MSFYMLEEDERKKEFVAVRMESKLFREIKTLANARNQDLSETIRQLCGNALQNES